MTRTRIGIALSTLVLGAAGLIGLAGCGGAEATALSAEGQTLAALGFEAAALEDPAPAPSGSADKGAKGAKDKPRAGERRKLPRRNALHGEAVVQKKDGGTKTVVFQRGEVTAVDDKSVTVKSTDGFTQTWSFGTPLRVVERRAAVQPSAVKVGTKVGVAGDKTGGNPAAHLIAIPKKQ
jgi:hypothetical protein